MLPSIISLSTVVSVLIDSTDSVLNKSLEKNANISVGATVPVSTTRALSQPYWLEHKMSEGTFTVNDQLKIGVPENPPSIQVRFNMLIEGNPFTFNKPVRYRYTDPVKGEIYQPVNIVPAATLSTEPSVLVFRKDKPIDD